MTKKAETSNIVDHPALDAQSSILRRMNLGVMDVLTPLIGFENGTYALHCAGYEYMGDIAVAKRSDLSTVRGMTENKIKKISAYLRKLELTFEMDATEWTKWRETMLVDDDYAPVQQRSSRPLLRLVR